MSVKEFVVTNRTLENCTRVEILHDLQKAHRSINSVWKQTNDVMKLTKGLPVGWVLKPLTNLRYIVGPQK